MKIEDRVRESLSRRASTVVPREDAWRSIERGVTFRAKRRLAMIGDFRSRLAAAAVAAAALAALGVLLWRTIQPAAYRPGQIGGTGPSGRIVFTSPGERVALGLFVLDLASGNVTALSESRACCALGAWSPDGSSIAYVLEEAGGERYAIVVARADGSNPVRILEHDKVPETPGPDLASLSWSPDGSQIVYTRRTPGRGFSVWVMDADGDGNGELPLKGVWVGAHWSPDGDRLLLLGSPQKADPAPFDLYTMRLDGSDLVQLTDDEEIEHTLSWSPDGAQIAYAVSGGKYDEPDYDQDVYVMDADGSNVRRLTDWEGLDFFPVWSPDGNWIAFASDRDATAERRRANREGEAPYGGLSMYVMRADGSDVVRLLDAGDGLALPTSWTR